MKNIIKQHYILIVLGSMLTIMMTLSSCSSGTYSPCSAYNSVELEITK